MPSLQLILNAKCHAIRDAQVLEKEEIGKEMTAEEKRLDQMMEYDRVNAIKVEEGIDKKRAEERRLGALKVMEQIDTNEQVTSHSAGHVACILCRQRATCTSPRSGRRTVV